MSPFKDSSLLSIKKLNKKDSVSTVLHDADLQNTDGKTGMTNIPFKDIVFKGYVSDLRDTYNGFKAHPQLFTEADVLVKKYIVVAAYNSNGGFIQTYIRALVVSSGSINTGISYAEGTGYFLNKPKGTFSKEFDLYNEGPGKVGVDTKSAGEGATYIRAWGPTTGKGIAPTTIKEYAITKKAKISVSGLKSATVYGFREAILLPVPRKSKPDSLISTEKMSVPKISGTTHKIEFNDNDETHYVWSDWQYITAT